MFEEDEGVGLRVQQSGGRLARGTRIAGRSSVEN